MADSILKNILSQYNQKKISAEYEAEQRKQDIYKRYPKLQDIDDKLTKLAISTTKSLINNNDKELLKELNENINHLKEEKNKILKSLNIKTNDIVNIEQDGDKLIVSIPKKRKISLKERFQEYHGENLAKEFSWDGNVGKEIW